MGADGSYELKIEGDLLDYAQRVALKHAKEAVQLARGRGRWLDEEELVQAAMLALVSKPPVYDPSRGRSPRRCSTRSSIAVCSKPPVARRRSWCVSGRISGCRTSANAKR